MLRRVRRGVFETNSSSVHTLTMLGGGLSESVLVVGFDGFIDVPAMEFGWGPETYTDQLSKLAYLLMVIVETEGVTSLVDLYNSKSFGRLESVIIGYSGCKGLTAKSLNFTADRYNVRGKIHVEVRHDGYIDSQSRSRYRSLDDFLSQTGYSILDIVYNSQVELRISNDQMQ